MTKLLGIAHTSVVVADMDRSLRFYQRLLGMTVTTDSGVKGPFVSSVAGLPDVRMRIVLLDAGDPVARVELLQFHTPTSSGTAPELPAIGTSHVAFLTDDIHKLHARLTAADVEAVSPPMNDGRQWAMHVYDPDGIRVELIQSETPSTAASA
jgi:catechol 2,3-dioxygenase-like lactoylglutathione lyase family enzyme